MQLVWEGNWLVPNGHSTVCRNMVRCLSKLGVDVKLDTTERPDPKRYAAYLDKGLLHMAKKAKRPSRERIRIIHRTPLDFHRHGDHLTFGMTYSEASSVPRRWVRAAHHKVDALLLANHASAQAFQCTGYSGPVVFAPQGVNTQIFCPGHSGSEALLPFPGFRFLSVFEWVYRKGYDVLLRAYLEEFTANEPVCLVIKTKSYQDEGGLSPRAYITALKKTLGVESGPTVFLYDGTLSTEVLAALYRACHAFVLPTRGEGIGLPFLEAGGSGIPVIATGFGGHMEFLSEENAYIVSHDLSPVPEQCKTHYASMRGSWAEPEVNSLRRQMRRVYEAYNEAKNKARILCHSIQENWSWDACARRFIDNLEDFTGYKLRSEG